MRLLPSRYSTIAGCTAASKPSRSAFARSSNGSRVVVIGDSFVEGWGVADHERMTNILETRTKIPHLNFGTAGNFGTTQAYILYEKLASRFDHDAVIWMILPANDFADDTPTASRLEEGARWRPYLVRNDKSDTYDVVYPAGGFEEATRWAIFRRNISVEFWMTARAYYYYRGLFDWLSHETEVTRTPSTKTPSNYFDFDDEQFGRLAFAARKIRQAAGDRRIMVVTIPRSADIMRSNEERGLSPLNRRITQLSKELGFDHIDLLASIRSTKWDNYYIPCDGHWTYQGHLFAANHLYQTQYYNSVRSGVKK
ncbi:hypothetical protein C5748_10910 [Phyllobacterium phragmitis]|uniref:SGNH hydrolase-type esterase domain-containing protein n=1 Tax=Phyllobacterium phragmitis TaxID=2670329 RepID=A0A2S9ITB8_9HYPH|nr:hypothetical protein C5748_10910 [Phyllobacterium phragmitis]